MKESFQKIVAWAKEHPYMAAAILAGVVFLAWWTVKNGGGNGGGGSGGYTAMPEGDPSGGLAASGGFGALPGLPALETPTLEPVESVSYETIPSGGGDGSFTSFDSYSPVDYSSLGGGSYASGVPLASPVMESFAGASLGGGGLTAQSPKNFQNAILASDVKADGGLTAKPNRKELYVETVRKEAVSSTKKSVPANPSPAYKAGKGQRFTGIHNGVTYVNGYPLFSSGVFGTSVSTPGGASSMPLKIQTIANPAAQGLGGHTIVTSTQGGTTGTIKTLSGRSAAVKSSDLKK